MVRDVACPREHWLADVNVGKEFLTSLIEWEIKVAAYEVASADKISEAVRVATIMDHAGCSEVDASFITSGTET